MSDLPLSKPISTEYPWHQLMCPACGAPTRAPWPKGVPSGTYGPRVHATVALCTGAYRFSKRTTAPVRGDLFGVPMRVGTISQSARATAAVLAAPVAEARAYVQEQAVAYLDETRGRQGAPRAWLWGAVTGLVTVFVVRLSRGGQVARELLGPTFGEILVTNRSRADNGYPVWGRQLCWAHVLRDFAAIRDRGGPSTPLGEAWRTQAPQRFPWWHRVRAGTLQRATFRSDMTPLRREVIRLVEAGQRCGVSPTAGTCQALLPQRAALWTFVQVPGVEPTKNAAERAMRPGVLWRKGSFGTQSEAGPGFVASMMTVATTLKQQQRPTLPYLTAAHEAALRGATALSLLPASVQAAHVAA